MAAILLIPREQLHIREPESYTDIEVYRNRAGKWEANLRVDSCAAVETSLCFLTTDALKVWLGIVVAALGMPADSITEPTANCVYTTRHYAYTREYNGPREES